ncbi:MAG: DUF4160 domain-containing protein [Dehalococcoidia bacterium]|nr:DUF4160 domain-containing protein [Dehalococcoidia bacterium]
MPRISEFYGITIAMYYNVHEPPHIHVTYGEHQALIGIQPLSTIRGGLPLRALGLVTECMALQQIELVENWRLARERRQLRRIAPLE